MFSYDSMGTGGALGPTQIRLLHLLPAKESTNPIACRLEVVAFEENPVYEALSYCWGDNTLLQGIKCNNEAFQVTESLFSALQHLRNDHTERTLWIDPICINQNDLERQSQVKLMKDIYTKSETVVIWLGLDPASDGVYHLFEMLQTISNLPSPQLSKKERIFFEMNLFDADRWHQDEDNISSKVPDEIKNDFVIPNEAKKGAIAVLTRPWWTRTWTVQEMVLAPSATIMCGHLSAPASEVRRACADILMHAVNDAFDAGDDDDDLLSFGDLFDDPNGTLYMARMRTHPSVSAKMELRKLLQFLRWLKAKDPRDKVYGSLGIAASTYGIEPEYTISTVECCTLC